MRTFATSQSSFDADADAATRAHIAERATLFVALVAAREALQPFSHASDPVSVEEQAIAAGVARCAAEALAAYRGLNDLDLPEPRLGDRAEEYAARIFEPAFAAKLVGIVKSWAQRGYRRNVLRHDVRFGRDIDERRPEVARAVTVAPEQLCFPEDGSEETLEARAVAWLVSEGATEDHALVYVAARSGASYEEIAERFRVRGREVKHSTLRQWVKRIRDRYESRLDASFRASS